MDPELKTILLTLIRSGAFSTIIKIVSDKIDARNGVKKMLHSIQEELGEEKEQRMERDARAARSQIIRFNDELLNGMRHSKSMFDSILVDCSDYEHYCECHPHFQNGVATEAIANVRRCYRKCEEDRDFL